jgi:porphobilinogen synthase
MPGIYRLSIDQVLEQAKEAARLGIKAIALFPAIENDLKSADAYEAYNLDNLICRAIRAVKNIDIKIGVICDVALDPYTTHGHDGVLKDNEVDNDATIEALARQALTLAKAGVDIIAPSDMMDGRVLKIRNSLDEAFFTNINILAYAAKYNSSFYGPFRNAVNSKQNKYLCKATYQMDIRNQKEALREILHDTQEGADMIMIKPALSCLDVIFSAKQKFDLPIFAFQVSGEYSMLKFAAINEAIIYEKAMIESLISIKRAGASAIFTYGALEIAKLINN